MGEFRNIFKEDIIIKNIKININIVKCLGIYIGYNKIECNEKNWLCKLREFEKILDLWWIRKLIFFGKC